MTPAGFGRVLNSRQVIVRSALATTSTALLISFGCAAIAHERTAGDTSGKTATTTTMATSEAPAEPSLLRVCAASKEAPFSERGAAGFENKIAIAVGNEMGRKVRFVWYDKPAIYLVRDQLKTKKCDVVVGLDKGDPRVLTTEPYLRAPYVFVQRHDSELVIDNWGSPDLAKASKIGFVDSSPPAVMMRRRGLYSVHFNYMKSLLNFKSRRNQYIRVDPARIVGEVGDGTADVAAVFGPEVARYVKANPDLKMTVIPDDNLREDGEKVPHHFDQSMGVRIGDTKLLAALNKAIKRALPKIREILEADGVPLLPFVEKAMLPLPTRFE